MRLMISIYAFNSKNVLERQAANNEIARLVVGKPMRAPYGPTEIEHVDIYKTKRANAPVMIFIHGGSWRSRRSADFAVYAEPFVKAGANFVAIDFTNVRETNGDIFPMVDQCRRAVSWTYRNAASFGGNADQIYLCSRSSGSHLAGCVVTTNGTSRVCLLTSSKVECLAAECTISSQYDFRCDQSS